MKTATERIEEIFYAALDLKTQEERRAFLDRACAGDANLRATVEELLTVQPDAERFFRDGGVSRARVAEVLHELAGADGRRDAAGLELSADEELGKRIGPYKLLQRIGEGGCGSVYMAEQETPVHRRVALKVIKLGMDTRGVIARFEQERQALALMDHPNIARVLDAGATDTGRPYFVMELVRGVKLTTYCDQNQLDTPQRLHLFIQVCHAIQHAHQKGIIHRDIKPSNVLVTMLDGAPMPVVIDFGIAKAIEGPLTDQTMFTAYDQFIGTPAYMSPEQAEFSRMDVDTRSDIYSLGVLLYELLTGRTPFDPNALMQSGFDEMRRTLREREPLRPSTVVTSLRGDDLTKTAQCRHAEPVRLVSQLRGDLDWIVMKALEKDRNRRYQTANALAMDVQRYLNNEPILARPPTRLYRLQKLIRRNKVAFAAGAAVAVALAAGLTVSIWLLLRERQLRQRAVAAEREQARLRDIAERGLATEAELRRQSEAREKIIQAAALIGQAAYAEADQLIAQLPAEHSTMEGAAVFRTLGDWSALQGNWPAARDRFWQLHQASRIDEPSYTSLDCTRTAAAFVEAGDRAGYERFRQEAIQTFGGTADPVVAERTFKNCLLLPGSESLMQSLTPLVQLAKSSLAGTDFASKDAGWQVPWRCLSLALWEYRSGKFSEAIIWSQRCLGYGDRPLPRAAGAQAVLAMALYRLGDETTARAELAQARAAVEAKFGAGLDAGSDREGFWFDWVLDRILVREAGALIGNNSGISN
jgi:serine/threonine protein kinase